MDELSCVLCDIVTPLDVYNPFCPRCGAPLLFSIESRGRRAFRTDSVSPLERYLEFLPLDSIYTDASLGEIRTGLSELTRLRAEKALPRVYAKNETQNPTGSFKDRGTCVAVQKALSLGLKKIGTVSTGNMASSTAAYGAKSGLETVILVKEDISRAKLLSTSIFRPHLIKVSGDYGLLFKDSFKLGRKHGIYFMNSVDPLRIEGYKLTGFEIFEQLGRTSPDYIFVPLSSGGHLIGLMKAFFELKQEGFIDTLPVFVGVQAEGCAPLARAFILGFSQHERIPKARTIAHAISNPDPPGGNIVLKWIRETGGKILAVSDREILDAQERMASREGLLCLPASATPLAGLLKMSRDNPLDPEARIVLVVTGTGLKGLNELSEKTRKIHESDLEDLDNIVAGVLE